MTATSTTPEDEFRRLVNAGDAGALRREVARRDDLRSLVNAPIFAFDSPALVAVAGRGNLTLVDALLELGADPNKKSDWWAGGFHPLYQARGAVADRLIAAGAVMDACAAASLDRPDVLRRLLDDDPRAVHQRGGDGQTPLHFARSREVADMLIAAGADLDARDIDHRSTAAEWMVGERSGLAKHLVERGATADIFLAAALGLTGRAVALLENDSTDLLALRTSQGEYGEKPPSSFHIYEWTIGAGLPPVIVAARFGHDETLAAMMKFTSPVDALLLACHQGRADDAREIARVNPGLVEDLSAEDRRLVSVEAATGNAPAVAIMMELGFDPSPDEASKRPRGSALHWAAWEGSAACVETLLRYPAGRALLDLKDSTYGGTPLDWCLHGAANTGKPPAGYAEVERLLREASAG